MNLQIKELQKKFDDRNKETETIGYFKKLSLLL